MTKFHPPIPTVSDFDESTVYKSISKKDNLNPMDMCYSNNHPYIGIGIVLMGPINIPYFSDGCASDYAFQPLDIQNPEEWESTYQAYIVFDLNEQTHKICGKNNLKKLDEDSHSGHIPFDHATGSLRCNLGMIELAKKWWKKD